jgi:2-polyprenyl-6-methoxyphenol hydroxylase-like FAD-dependent oxidoreductase
MQQLSLNVLIIGAGTGGLALAHGLKQAGIGVKVFERDRSPRDAAGGYRVGISPGGTQALMTCLPPKLFELFLATSSRPPRYFNMLTEKFSNLISLEMQEDDPSRSEQNVNRLTLRRVLLTGLEDVVHFDKKFVVYEENEDCSVTVFFEDGTECHGDVLIGADGAGSRVRKQRLPDARHEETGILSLGGKLPITSESKALLSEKMFYGMSMILAPKGVGAIIHSLEFKWNRPDWNERFNNNSVNIIAEWPGFLNEGTEDYIGWGLWASRKQFPADPMKLTGVELIGLAMKMTEDWHPNFRKLLELTDPATMLPLNVRTSVPAPPWESSNVTLLGDAIHTMTPGKGAGANTALRDAVLLLKRLVEVSRGEKSTVQAFHEYESEMLRYSSKAVLESRKQMNENDAIHKPIIGAFQLGVMRNAMRLIDSVPMLKRRVTASVKRSRAAEEEPSAPIFAGSQATST